jgi:outer membrane protein TolC
MASRRIITSQTSMQKKEKMVKSKQVSMHTLARCSIRLSFLATLLSCITVFAHPSDSLRVLSQEAYLEIVRTYHPVARQGNLLVDRARAELTSARAGFDPLLYGSLERKTFDGKNYYNLFNSELKIPTWYGIELKAGLEQNVGDLINPEETLGLSSYLGISVPLAKNLVMDKRRAVLQQAKIFREQSKAERLLLINDLIFDASDAYWTWAKEYLSYQVLAEAVTVNLTRYDLVKLGFRQGDRPAIDTTEALAQLQAFELARNDAWLRFRKAGLDLSNYLWLANDTPYYMPPTVVPDTAWMSRNLSEIPVPVMEDLVRTALQTHPKLQAYDFKLQMLDIDRKLKFQDMLPMVNLNYNLLHEGYNVLEGASWNFYANNFKFGVDFGLPLRLSQGRGQYRAAKIKIEETGLNRMQDKLAIENKVKRYFNEVVVLQKQVSIAQDNYLNYLKLFRGEDTRFRIGESSLFLLNSRENKVLESRQKMIELKTKLFTAYIAMQWAMGQLR